MVAPFQTYAGEDVLAIGNKNLTSVLGQRQVCGVQLLPSSLRPCSIKELVPAREARA